MARDKKGRFISERTRIRLAAAAAKRAAALLAVPHEEVAKELLSGDTYSLGDAPNSPGKEAEAPLDTLDLEATHHSPESESKAWKAILIALSVIGLLCAAGWYALNRSQLESPPEPTELVSPAASSASASPSDTPTPMVTPSPSASATPVDFRKYSEPDND